MSVRELAYSKWEAAGFLGGDGFAFWLEAERKIHANNHPRLRVQNKGVRSQTSTRKSIVDDTGDIAMQSSTEAL